MSQIAYDLYGFESNDLNSKTKVLERVLGVKFVLRSSDYIGDHNNFRNENGESFDLRFNRDAEGELSESSHENMKLLFWVNNTQRGDKIKTLLTNNIPDIVFLRREVFGK